MFLSFFGIALILLGDLSLAPNAVQADSGDGKRILLVAGRPSHGYGAHEHYAGLKVLEEAVKELAPDVSTQVTFGWPESPSVVEQADTIVIYCDGGQRHVAMPHRDQIRQHLAKGGGLVALHYAVEMVPGEAGQDWVDLLGGHFEIHFSVNPHWQAEIKSLPQHPVTRGVSPMRIDDEWYFHMRFAQDGKLTPILQAVAPPETMVRKDGAHSGNPHVRRSVAAGEPQTLAWAYESPIGGRSFGFTGGHHHWNWAHESVRRVVSNAILWTAGLAVPQPESRLTPMGAKGLIANQDYPAPDNFSMQGVIEKFELPESVKADDVPNVAKTSGENNRKKRGRKKSS